MTIDCNIYESSLKNKYKSKIRINGSREEETLSLSLKSVQQKVKKKKRIKRDSFDVGFDTRTRDATRERAAIVSKIVVKSFERKQATVDKPPLLLDRNERSFRLGILMHRLSLLHPSSPPFLFHVSQAWIPRDCLVTFSPVSVSPFRSLPREWRPPIQIRGRAALISRLKELGLPSPRLPPVFSPLPPRFVNFFLPRGRKIAGTDFDQPFLKASAPRV